VERAVEEHGALANFLNLLGLICHKQSKFAQAIEYFEKAKQKNPSFIEASLNLAVTYSDLGFYDLASAAFHEAHSFLAQKENLPDLVLGRLANFHNRTAQGYEQATLVQEACQEYQKALEIYPKMPDIRLKLAKLYLKSGSFKQAEEQLKMLLLEMPNHIESLNLMGTIYYKKSDFESAMRYWNKVQQISPNDRPSRAYLKSLGRTLIEQSPN
jgi:tetratricopeptide (TPR) repeat protein